MTSVSTDRRQGLNSSAAFKVPARLATTATIAHAGLFAIDGVVPAAGDRIFDKDNTDPTLRGIWDADTGNWTRSLDFDGAYDAVEGTLITVAEGGVNGGSCWRLTTSNPVTIGTSNLTFTQALYSGLGSTSFTQSGTGAVPRAAQDKMRDIVSALDYGVVPNDNTKYAANLAALVKLVATVANGGDAGMQFTGTVWFPPVPAGKATYYIGGILPTRDGVGYDLGNNILHFSKADSALEQEAGFFYFRRNNFLQNGEIEVDYPSATVGRGNAIKINARYGDASQAPGNYFLNNYEEDQQPPIVAGNFVVGTTYTIDTIGTTNFTLIGAASNTVGINFTATGAGTGTGTAGTLMPQMPGNIRLKNLRITSNNPSASMVEIYGGVKGLEMDTVFIDGQNLAATGIDYEFGGATIAGNVNANQLSSHGCDFKFRNIHAVNLASAGDGTAIAIRGAYNVSVDGLYVNNVKTALSFSSGEAANFQPGITDTLGVKRNNIFRNIVGQNITVTGIVISGTTAWTGYLSPLAIQTQANVEGVQNDLVEAVIENFTLSGTNNGYGLSTSGAKVTARNGRISGFNSGVFDTGTRHLVLEEVDVFDSFSHGIRIDVGSIYPAGWTDRTVVIRGGTVAGNTGAGIGFFTSQANAIVQGITFGYNNQATGQFTVSDSNGAHSLTSITVNGVDCLGAVVSWAVSNASTAAAIAAQINTFTSAPDYLAVAYGATVLIRALAGTGPVGGASNGAPNGYVVAPIGTMVTTGLKNLSGGRMEGAQTSSVSVALGIKGVLVANCNTRAVAAGGTAYVNSNTDTSNGCNLVKNYGNDVTQSGPWDVDGIGQATAVNIADKTNTINTFRKYASRCAWDITNARLMVAVGNTATSNWKTADGATTVTPI